MDPVELRPAAPDDAEALTALVNRCWAHDGFPRRLALEEMQEEFLDPDFDPSTDSRVVLLGGQPVALGRIWFHEAGALQERVYLDADVDPTVRGRGIGRRLLAWQLERAHEVLSGLSTRLPRYIRVERYEHDVDAHRLYERFGLRPVRWFQEMLRPLDEPLPEAAPVPGVELVAWPHERDDELRAIKNLAFADHWGSAPMNEASWHSWMGSSQTRLDLSVAAVDTATGQLIGHCVCTHSPQDIEAIGRREGWIDNVGTVPAARGRGVASWMIAACMARFVAEEFTHAALAVDTDSPTRAPSVYLDLGFRPTVRSIHREIAL